MSPYFADQRSGQSTCRLYFRHPDIAWNLRGSFQSLLSAQYSFAIQKILSLLFWWSTSRVEYLIRQMSAKHHAELVAETIFLDLQDGVSPVRVPLDGDSEQMVWQDVCETPRGDSRQIRSGWTWRGESELLLTPRMCPPYGSRWISHRHPQQSPLGLGTPCAFLHLIARNYLNPLAEELQLQAVYCVKLAL